MSEDERIAKPLTNGDRIRAMSNEELAEYQIHRVDDCPDLIKVDAPCRIKKNYETQTDCKKCWLNWLNSQAESIESRGECDLNREANAALIAAAPEMYEALEFSKKEFHDLYFENCCEYIESVLKKARGEV